MKHLNTFGIVIACLICPCFTQAEPVRIGVLVPLTGEGASSYGDQVRKAVLLAESEFSIPESKLIFEDSRCQPHDAVTAARKLINFDKVNFIIGDVCWTDLIAPISEPAKVIVLSTGSAQSSVRDSGDYVFRLKLDVSVDSRALARATREQLKVRRVALLTVQDNWGEGIANNFRDEFVKSGGEIVREESFMQGSTDMKPLLLRIKQHDPELIMISAYPAQVGLIAIQARGLAISSRLAAYRGGIGDETLKIGGTAVEDLVFLEEYDERIAPDFVSNFHKRYGHNPNLFGAMGFDAYHLLEEAIGKCGTKADCVRDYLYSVKSWSGVSGTISFDDHGDVQKPLKLKQVRNGQFVDFAPQ